MEAQKSYDEFNPFSLHTRNMERSPAKLEAARRRNSHWKYYIGVVGRVKIWGSAPLGLKSPEKVHMGGSSERPLLFR